MVWLKAFGDCTCDTIACITENCLHRHDKQVNNGSGPVVVHNKSMMDASQVGCIIRNGSVVSE
jgi:hypothetical protein